MSILSIDSSSRFLSLAYFNDNSIIKRNIEIPNNLSVRIIKVFDDFLRENDIDRQNILSIDKLLLGAGPGSFTSLRIGFMFSKILSYVYKIPLFTVNSIFGSVYGYILNDESLRSRELVIALDTKRNEIFYCIIKVSSRDKFLQEGDLQIIEEIKLINTNALFSGDYSRKCIILTDLKDIPLSFKNTVRIENIGNAEALIYLQDLAVKPEDVLKLEPEYIRKSDAEINMKRRTENK